MKKRNYLKKDSGIKNSGSALVSWRLRSPPWHCDGKFRGA